MLPTALNIILYYITLFIFCLIFYLVCNYEAYTRVELFPDRARRRIHFLPGFLLPGSSFFFFYLVCNYLVCNYLVCNYLVCNLADSSNNSRRIQET